MKGFTKLAVAITAACCLIGTASLAGCRSKTTTTKVSSVANWNAVNSVAVESNSADYWKTHKEVSTFKLTFATGPNASYSVLYNTEAGAYKYETAFYMSDYDWTAEGIPEKYAKESVTSEPVYVYETKQILTGHFKYREEIHEFSDEITSVCKYRLAKDNLQPVYSYQSVSSTAPATLNANSLESAFVKTVANYETYYNYACKQATVTTVENPGEETEKQTVKKIKLTSDKGYSVFDNSQLRAAMRGFALSGTGAKTFNVVVPQNGAKQTLNSSTSKAKDLDDPIIETALKNAPKDYIFFDWGEDVEVPEGETAPAKPKIRYSAVKTTLSAKMAGQSVTQWYATVENPDMNFSRGALLKLIYPLSYNTGTLYYTLEKLEILPV